MIIITRPHISAPDLDRIREYVEARGLRARISEGEERSVVGCIGDVQAIDVDSVRALSGVADVVRVSKPYRLASLEFVARPTLVTVGGDARTMIGSEDIVVIAGPCSVEGREMLLESAHAVRTAGASMLRGGAFKPRTSPYAFQGLGEEALELLAAARSETGLPVVSEVLDPRQVELVAEHVDMLQIGARNMQNFALLAEVGRSERPVLLKRGMSATVAELLLAAEHVMARGNTQVVLCERGIRTFETATRNTLDLGAVAVLKRETHLPVIVDPSHAAGRADLVAPLAFAAIAAGADGLIVETHPDPATALSDGDQSLTLDAFASLMRQLRPFVEAAGRTMIVAPEPAANMFIG
ncbi:MAG: 3-deoxy-7-phosphoheptulonate synthase [Gemmatimonadaceae bacterium]